MGYSAVSTVKSVPKEQVVTLNLSSPLNKNAVITERSILFYLNTGTVNFLIGSQEVNYHSSSNAGWCGSECENNVPVLAIFQNSYHDFYFIIDIIPGFGSQMLSMNTNLTDIQDHNKEVIDVVNESLVNNTHIMNSEESSAISSSEELETFGFDFKLFPNPTVDESNILLNLEKAGIVSYDIFDMSGKLVASKSFGQVSPGKYLYKVNVQNLNSGLYFITMNLDGNQVTRKLSVN